MRRKQREAIDAARRKRDDDIRRRANDARARAHELQVEERQRVARLQERIASFVERMHARGYPGCEFIWVRRPSVLGMRAAQSAGWLIARIQTSSGGDKSEPTYATLSVLVDGRLVSAAPPSGREYPANVHQLGDQFRVVEDPISGTATAYHSSLRVCEDAIPASLGQLEAKFL